MEFYLGLHRVALPWWRTQGSDVSRDFHQDLLHYLRCFFLTDHGDPWRLQEWLRHLHWQSREPCRALPPNKRQGEFTWPGPRPPRREKFRHFAYVTNLLKLSQLCDVISKWEQALRSLGQGRLDSTRIMRLTYKNRWVRPRVQLHRRSFASCETRYCVSGCLVQSEHCCERRGKPVYQVSARMLGNMFW